jgi:phage terminase large subunit-like protein
VVRTFTEVFVHTKGSWARKRFVLEPFQADEIIRPLFGEVIWSPEWDRYVRRYRIAYIVVARKNGKTEIAAGTVLVLLVADDEEAAEIYGAATDTKQADKVGAVVERMRQLEPRLGDRLGHNKHSMRTYDESTGSYYELIPADALGELGANPHGFVLDEFLTQSGGDLWDALRTGAGTRTQPLFLGVSTETNDPFSWGAETIDEAERIAEDPSRAPHVFTFIRRAPLNDDELERLRRLHPNHPDLPVSCDIWDERNWRWPNPALGSFLSVQSLREEALEAQNQPAKENAFRQFRMNQRVQQATRFVSLDEWDACAGEVAPNPEWVVPKLAGKRCFAGLDLSSKLDMTAWCLVFDDGWAWWRFWLPEDQAGFLDGHTGGQVSQWAKDGWITLTDGDVIDYDRVYLDIEADHKRFAIADITYDPWSGEPVRQEIEKRTGLTMLPLKQTFDGMTAPMNEFRRLLKEPGAFRHGANPVARWHADSVEAKSPSDDPDRFRPVKPDRAKTGKRIDGMPTLFMALDGRMRRASKAQEPPRTLVSW